MRKYKVLFQIFTNPERPTRKSVKKVAPTFTNVHVETILKNLSTLENIKHIKP